jgi:uncharacterized membrane protein YbhN (UPF0104 family)
VKRSASASAAIAAQVALAAVAIWFAARTVVRQWDSVRESAAGLSPHWLLILLASVIVLATYTILAEAWRRIVGGWGTPLRFMDGMRIWAISILGRYIPGKVWQLGAMAALAQREKVSGLAAAGSAVLVTVIHTLAGFGVVAVFGLQLLDLESLGLAALVLSAIVVLLAPQLLPWAATMAGRLRGREIVIPVLPHGVLWLTVAISAVAWIAYGVAFHLLARAVLGAEATGGVPDYIAIYAFSYLIGFLALFAPGGIVVREIALVAALVNTGMPEGSAIVLAVVSRLWLTVLELTPALSFLVYDQFGRPRPPRNAAEESPL